MGLSFGLGWQGLGQFALQLSEENIGLRQALLAFAGVFERRLQISTNNPNEIDSQQMLTSALQHQYKAIRHFQLEFEHYLRSSLESALLFCIIFIMFDYIHGDDVAARVHLHGGTAILRQFVAGTDLLQRSIWSRTRLWRTGEIDEVESISWDPKPTEQPREQLQRQLVLVFSYLDFWASLWLEDESSLPEVTTLTGLGVRLRYLSRDDLSLANVVDEFSPLQLRIQEFLRAAKARNRLDVPAEISESFTEMKRFLLSTLQERHQMFQQFYLEHVHEDELSSPKLQLTFAITAVNYKKIELMLLACQEDGSNTYNTYDSNFEEIVFMSASIVHMENFPTGSSFHTHSPLAFTRGVIHPLYLTAISCSNLEICRKAIELLSSSHWVEGAWDSSVMAKIAQRKLIDRFHLTDGAYL